MRAAIFTDHGGVLDVGHAGVTMRFGSPSPLVRHNVEHMFTSEPTTIPWLDAIEPGEMFVDVGANIGLYSVYAAVVSQAVVFSFEPESQNFAELNRNLFLNALHERVTAYCVALSDRFGLSHLYLCTFAVGFGHHDFGANSWVADLQRGPVVYPKNRRLRQGAVGMKLDDLVESGVLPVPNHIKIDVDGFERKVLEGASRTLARSEVKSVLIETDFAISESVETVSYMTERGWRVSPDQLRILRNEVLERGALSSRIKSGAGQQNFIYFRDTDKYMRVFESFASSWTSTYDELP